MSTKAQLRRWLKRANTAHSKLVELAEAIESEDGDSELHGLVAGAHCEVYQVVNVLEAALDE
jgi:hypothetical protein